MSRDRAATGLVVAAVADELAAALDALDLRVDLAVRGDQGPLQGVVVVLTLPLGDAARLALGLKEWGATGG